MDLDTQLFYAINGLARNWATADEAMRLVSRPWSYVVPGIFAALWWYRKEGRRSFALAAALAILIGLTDWSALGIKQLTQRSRPCQSLSQVIKVTGCGRSSSFPSNHAVNTAAASVFLQTIYPRLGWAVWPFTLIIGFNRIYVGAHYPTDVVGGWLIGIADAWAFIVFLRARRWVLRPVPGAIARP